MELVLVTGGAKTWFREGAQLEKTTNCLLRGLWNLG